MKKLTVVFILCLATLFTGCTLMDTPSQRSRAILQGMSLDMRAAVEDFDYLFLINRNSALTQWHPRTGH